MSSKGIYPQTMDEIRSTLFITEDMKSRYDSADDIPEELVKLVHGMVRNAQDPSKYPWDVLVLKNNVYPDEDIVSVIAATDEVEKKVAEWQKTQKAYDAVMNKIIRQAYEETEKTKTSILTMSNMTRQRQRVRKRVVELMKERKVTVPMTLAEWLQDEETVEVFYREETMDTFPGYEYGQEYFASMKAEAGPV